MSVRAWLIGVGFALACLVTACSAPDYPNCENDDHCRRDNRREWCIRGRCQQCRNTADCRPGQTCLRNRCYDGPSPCENDADCPTDQRCQANRCVARNECDDARPCGANMQCQGGRCVAAAPVLDPVENRGTQCALEPVYFNFDDSTLDDGARRALQNNSECIQREQTSRYVLIGRADPRGTTEYNLALGERRARSVQRYLINLGVLPDRLAVSSEGSEAATGSDESSWSRDRRVDFRLRQ